MSPAFIMRISRNIRNSKPRNPSPIAFPFLRFAHHGFPSHLLPEANRVALAALANEAANPRDVFEQFAPFEKGSIFLNREVRGKVFPIIISHFFKSSYLKFRLFLPNSTQLSHLPPQPKKVVQFPGIPHPLHWKKRHTFFPTQRRNGHPRPFGTWAFCSKSLGLARRPFFLEESHPNLTDLPGSGWINGLGLPMGDFSARKINGVFVGGL